MPPHLLFRAALMAGLCFFDAHAVLAEDARGSAGDRFVSCRGVVSLVDEARLPARVSAVVAELLAKEGDRVEAGQLLGMLRAERAQAELAIATGERDIEHLQSIDSIRQKSASAKAKVASAEHAEAVAINQRAPGAVPPLRVRRLRLAEDQAALEVEVAEQEQQVQRLRYELSERKVEAAQLLLERSRIVSPLDGLVAKRAANVGEWIEAGDPVYYVVRMNRLRLEWLAPSDQLPPHKMLGTPVKAEVSLGQGETATIDSSISFVSPLIEPSGDYRVWCDFENLQRDASWLFRPGQVATVRVLLAATADAEAVASASKD